VLALDGVLTGKVEAVSTSFNTLFEIARTAYGHTPEGARLGKFPERMKAVKGSSSRDEVIATSTLLREARSDAANLRLNYGAQDFIAIEEAVLNNSISADKLLGSYPSELEQITNRISDSLSFLEIDKSRIFGIDRLIANPMMKYVPANFVKAQAVSLPPQSGHVGAPPVLNTAAAVAGATTAGKVSAVPGEGEKIAKEIGVELKTVGSMNEEDWGQFVDYMKGVWKPKIADLSMLGYIKPGVKAVDNPDVWTGKDEVKSKEDVDSKLDKIVLAYGIRGYNDIQRAGLIKRDSLPGEVAGYLAVRIVHGLGAAKSIATGASFPEFDGTKSAVAASTVDTPEKAMAETQNNFVPDAGTFSIPEPATGATYPYNAVTQYEGGHVTEFDSTPGSERVAVRHKTGTGYEFSPEGNEVVTVRGNGYRAVLGNDHIKIMGHAFIHVEGDASVVGDNVRITAENDLILTAGGKTIIKTGDMEMEVSGQKLETVRGDSATNVGGFAAVTAEGDLQLDGGSISAIGREGSLNLLGKAGIGIASDADVTVAASGNASFAAAGNASVGAGGNMSVHGNGDATFSSDGSTSIGSGGDIKLSHPVEAAKYAHSAGRAPDGNATVVTPSGSSASFDASEETGGISDSIAKFTTSSFGESQAPKSSTPSSTVVSGRSQ
jgi:hypothetical protein